MVVVKLIIEGRVLRKDRRGRLELIQRIKKDQGCDSYEEMKRKTDN